MSIMYDPYGFMLTKLFRISAAPLEKRDKKRGRRKKEGETVEKERGMEPEW